MRSDGGENAAEKIIQRPRAHARIEIRSGYFSAVFPALPLLPPSLYQKEPV